MEVVPPYYIQPSYPVHSTLGILKLEDIESETSAFMALHQRLEEELRAAKRAQLSCGEVLLPPDLLRRIARDVLKMAESEPCGLRGCTLYLNFEGDQECRKIGTIKCDTNTVSTFELFLTLKQDPRNTWSLIPLFIRNLTKGGTIVIDQEFTIEKRKLYRSFLE
ncbi:protein charybde-like isoform X2 [Daktulosphaira vitifoliae]|uniref:protein charybde-like isoform X2 n=1 Tax=Daktulosphaira vitifoliae TaxID=58002 RepID=UPI0021AA9312|nr:protein charybde-like isoform X2 [Daktulosphaira vitifoliae]